MKTSNLDERQEQVLLNLEHNCCWIAYWGLLIAMVLQVVFYGFDPERLVGEWCIFMVLCIYMSYACLKNGIWDRRLKPNRKTNLIVSAIAAVLCGAVCTVGICNRFDAEALDYVISFCGVTVATFALCFAALSIAARAHNKKQADLETEEPEE